MGASILYNLAARGATDTLLLEKDVLAAGSTSLSQGILRMHYSNEVTTRMAWESLRVLQAFEETVGGPSGYVRTGYLLIAGEGDRAVLEENVAMQQGLGVASELMSPGELGEIAPALSFKPGEMCAYEPESGYADPYAVTHSYATRARELGAQAQLQTAVTDIELRNGRVSAVATEDGVISTPVVVVAAGPWSRPLLKRVGVDVPLQTVRHQVITLRRPDREAPEHPGIGDLPNSLSARPDGNLTLIGVGEEEPANPEDYDHGVDMLAVEDVSAKLTSRMPGMSGALFRGGWSGLFTTTPDWHPVLDQVDGIEGLYCAVGFSGHGFKLSPMVGVAMAEMVLDGASTTIDVSELDLSRFRLQASKESARGISGLDRSSVEDREFRCPWLRFCRYATTAQAKLSTPVPWAGAVQSPRRSVVAPSGSGRPNSGCIAIRAEQALPVHCDFATAPR